MLRAGTAARFACFVILALVLLASFFDGVSATPRFQKPCSRTSCCKSLLARAKTYGVVCPKAKCKEGGNTYVSIPSTKKNGCTAKFWGACPTWFNKGCKYTKPTRG
jgi:hypothetical protein